MNKTEANLSKESCILLAIESSCDETSASVLKDGVILSNVIADQSVHEEYGGVVPELASRAHQKNIVPVVSAALAKAQCTKSDLNAVAFTRGPGLLGSLLVGSSFAKSLALGLDIPLIEVNHMQAHILAHFIDEPSPQFPFLCLTVSGGHTQIVKVNAYGEMEIIGETQDDAVGEAFDKTAKIMGLPYPGGPLIDRYAQKGNPHAYPFPNVDVPGLNYSFSGIKTAFMNFLNKEKNKNPDFIQENLADISASIQCTLVNLLFQKLIKAVQETGIQEVAIAGGVSANSALRQRLIEEGKQRGWQTYIPAFEYCTDNAAMVAVAAYFKFQKGDFVDQTVSPLARLKF